MGLETDMFEGPLDPEFVCELCSRVLINPVTAGCSHIFCQECVARMLKSRITTPKCPTCSTTITREIHEPTIDFKFKLLNLRIKCSNKCGEIVLLGELPDHIDTCPHAPVDCNFKSKGCTRKVKRCDLKKHLEECDYRTVNCEACDHETLYRELYTHQSRVRCLETKLKQQIVRERKAASHEINKHRERLFKDNVRLDQQQRKMLLSHSKSMCLRKTSRKSEAINQQRTRTDSNLEFAYSPSENVFLTEQRIAEEDEVHYNNAEHNEMEDIRNSRYMTKTPHSSRSGFAIQMCSQCNRKFRPDGNHPHACRWHTGIQVFTCFACGRLDYLPGCAVSYHKI